MISPSCSMTGISCQEQHRPALVGRTKRARCGLHAPPRVRCSRQRRPSLSPPAALLSAAGGPLVRTLDASSDTVWGRKRRETEASELGRPLRRRRGWGRGDAVMSLGAQCRPPRCAAALDHRSPGVALRFGESPSPNAPTMSRARRVCCQPSVRWQHLENGTENEHRMRCMAAEFAFTRSVERSADNGRVAGPSIEARSQG